MSARRTRVTAIALAATVLVMLAVGDSLVLVDHLQHRPHAYPFWLEGSSAVVTWTAVGLLLSLRVPGNPLGRLALAFIVLAAMQGLAGAIATHIRDAGGPAAAVNDLAALAAFCQLTSVGGMVLFAELVPDGRSASRRWRPLTFLTVVAIGVIGLRNAVTDSGVSGVVTDARTPFTWVPHAVVTGLDIANALLVTCLFLAVASIVTRWRSSSGVERQQLKWIVFAVVAAVTLGVVLQPVFNWLWPDLTWAGSVLWAFIGASLPVSTAVAIMRYRLYDIDRIVSRTVSYAIVTGAIAAIYLGAIALADRVLSFSSSFAVAASTLAVAAVFQPLRRRIQAAVDRRFDRASYDARRTVDAFSARLRDQVDSDAVRQDLLRTVTDAVAPATASLWLVAT